ncbi:hypothetical protein L596_013204 [Steinernema carpocapsae]|uniref:BTB domain-containing protein n=1 Tax=Steinernema carpocapsae TaxID=34508 RepID=A0A4U5P0B2_STECR|nr:hypothetical protein L596_013204 [Steinernema carpocapsae]
MTIKGVIPFKFTDTEPASIEIGDFLLTLERSHCNNASNFSFHIKCKPKNERRTVLWNCVTSGVIAAVHEENQAFYQMWHRSYGNVAVGVTISHGKNYHYFSKALQLVGQPNIRDARGEIHVEILDSFIADLSDPENPLIQGRGDAVKFSSGGVELWISKKKMFAIENFLDEFLHFIGIIHGLDVYIGAENVVGLLKLADVFKCESVDRRCEDFLRGASFEQVPLVKKLLLCDRFKLNTFLAEAIGKMSIEEWKTLHLPGGFSPVASFIMAQKIRVVDPPRQEECVLL